MTTEEQHPQKLFPEFQTDGATAAADWEQKARKDLRDIPLERLTWHTYEGIDIKPFYTAQDTAKLPFAQQKPGDFAFLRGNKTGDNGWLNIQRIRVAGDGHAAIDKAADALQRGADGIHFALGDAGAFDVAYLASTVNICQFHISYTLQEQPKDFLKRLYAELEKQQVSHRNLKGFVAYDPMTAKGALSKEEARNIGRILDLTKDSSDFYGITVNGTNFSSIGASITQEIAYTLSAAVAYIDRLTTAGQPLESVLRNMQFHMASGTNYFFEIVKLRTIRLLWAAVVEAYQAEGALAAKLRIHSSTSSWFQTTLDPYMNMLRVTTEAMAAVMAGCDSLTVTPFDDTFEEPTEFSERIARNVSIILKEEAYLDKAIDPAAGSYYLETLTHELADSAWKLFKEVEELGGFEAAYDSGHILAAITEVSRKKFKNIASGRDVLVGTNKYPTPAGSLSFDPEALIQNADFDTSRAAYPTEVIRMATELHLRKRNRRPKALVAIIDKDKKKHTDATFAEEFFSCLGFETETVHFETVAAASNQLDQTVADVVIVSASEAAYVKEFGPRLRNHHARPTIILAADPVQMKEEMIDNGYEEFIFEGCDMSTIMHLVHQKLHRPESDDKAE